MNVEKGVSSGDDLAHDWWNKMLAGLGRVPDAVRRGLIQKFPSAVQLSRRLRRLSREEGIALLANVQSTTGRRLGPALGARLHVFLTDSTGLEGCYG